MILWCKKSINKIYPFFDMDEIQDDNIIITDEYNLNFCCFINSTNDYYMYSYFIIKNNFTLRSHVDKIKSNSINDAIHKVIINSLEQSIKYKIKNITIQNDKYDIIHMLQNSTNKKLKKITNQFDNIIWKNITNTDNSKSYLLCDQFIENTNKIDSDKKN